MKTVKMGDRFTFLKSFDRKDWYDPDYLPVIPAGSVGTIVKITKNRMILEIPDPWAPGKPAAELKKYRCQLYRNGDQWVAWNNVVANIQKYKPLDLGPSDELPFDEGGFESPDESWMGAHEVDIWTKRTVHWMTAWFLGPCEED